jgi:hypothetical protein
MPPLGQYFVTQAKGQTSPLLPQRARTLGFCGLFPCKPARFQGTSGRGHARDLGPWARRRSYLVWGRRPCPRYGSTCSCVRSQKELAAMCVPKGRGPPGTLGSFSSNQPFWRVPKGVPWVADHGPQQLPRPTSRRGAGGKSHAPVVAVLLGTWKELRQTLHCGAQKRYVEMMSHADGDPAARRSRCLAYTLSATSESTCTA